MRSPILTDVDSVLLNYDVGFFSFASKKGFGQLPFQGHVPFHHRLNVDASTVMQLIEDFGKSEEFSQLPVYRDAKEHLTLLASVGYRFTAITAPGDAGHIVTKRIANLKLHFGDIFNDVICLPVGESKTPVLKSWEGSKQLWIEDNPEHAIAGATLGLRSVIIDHEYNQLDDATHLIYRVPNKTPWKSITGYVQFIEDMSTYEH